MSATRIRELRAARIRLGFVPDLTELPPPVRRGIEKDRADGLGWRHDGLSGWSTEEIIGKLREMSIDTDSARLREQAERAATVAALATSWSASRETTGPWADFPLVAAEELWVRLLPGIDCPEVASRRLDEAVLAGSRDNIRIPAGKAERRDLWRAVAEFLDYIVQDPPEGRPSRFAEAQACSPIDYENIVLELIKHADAAELDEANGPLALLLQLIPNALTLGCVGVAYARSGRPDQAQDAIGRNLAQYPDSAWARETAGEAHLLLGRADQAIASFEAALRRAQSALEWGELLDHMCTSVTTQALDAATELRVSQALDRLVDQVPPPDD